MFSGIDFLLKRTMSSFFNAIKNLLTAYHIDKSSTGKIIEPEFFKAHYQLSNRGKLSDKEKKVNNFYFKLLDNNVNFTSF